MSDTEGALQEARDRFEREQPRYRRAADAVAEEIKEVARSIGVTVRASGREKSLDSFVKKALSKPYARPWEQTTDKAGARGVVSDPSQLYPLVEALEASWSGRLLGERQDKRFELDDNVFDYSGIHLQVVAPLEDGDTEPIQCEVQVRTAAQDAWSILSHQFLYKPVVAVPPATRRAMFRLVALVEVFDEEVQRVVTATLADPDYPQARLLQDAERVFYGLTHWDYNRALSEVVLTAAVHAVPEAERHTYGDRLEQFVREHRERLIELYGDYAPGTDLGRLSRYALVTQPESLVLFERVENAEHLLLHAVNEFGGPDLRRLVDPALAAWGKPFTDV